MNERIVRISPEQLAVLIRDGRVESVVVETVGSTAIASPIALTLCVKHGRSDYPGAYTAVKADKIKGRLMVMSGAGGEVLDLFTGKKIELGYFVKLHHNSQDYWYCGDDEENGCAKWSASTGAAAEVDKALADKVADLYSAQVVHKDDFPYLT